MPVLRSIRERFAQGAAARRREGRRLPARDGRDGEPRPGAGGRRRGGRPLLGEPARPRTRSRQRSPGTACRCSRARGEDAEAYAGTWRRSPSGSRTSRSTTGPTCSLLHRCERPARGCRGDHHRSVAVASAGGRGEARLPGDRGERVAHGAHVQRPLRHRPIGARRHPARHQPAAGRAHARAVRLRATGRGIAQRARGAGAAVVVCEWTRCARSRRAWTVTT